jgi:hypothetical protein
MNKATWIILGLVVMLIFAYGIHALDARLKYIEAHPEYGKINCTYSEPEIHCFKYAYRLDGEVACERNQWDYYYNISYCIGSDCNGYMCVNEIYGAKMIR